IFDVQLRCQILHPWKRGGLLQVIQDHRIGDGIGGKLKAVALSPWRSPTDWIPPPRLQPRKSPPASHFTQMLPWLNGTFCSLLPCWPVTSFVKRASSKL